MTPVEFYQQHGAKIIGDDIGRRMGDGFRAMQRADDASLADFAKRVTTASEIKKTYFEMKPEQGILSGTPTIIPADSIRHWRSRHPNLTDEDLGRLPRVLDALDATNTCLPRNDVPRFAGKGILGWATVDGQAYGVILESVRPDRTIVATFFKDSEVGIRNWFDLQGDTQKVVTTPAALWPSQAPKGDVLRDQPSSDKNITQPDDKGNTLYQDAPPTDTPAFKSWFGDSKVVDDAGKPLTLWHQTGADIEAFDPRMWLKTAPHGIWKPLGCCRQFRHDRPSVDRLSFEPLGSCRKFRHDRPNGARA